MGIREAVQSKFTELEGEIALRDSRIDLLAGQIQRLASGQVIAPQAAYGDSGLPQTFEVHTPPVVSAPPPRGVFAACGMPHPFANAETTQSCARLGYAPAPSMPVGQACVEVLGSALGFPPQQ